VDKRDSRSKGGLPCSNTPTVTSWRLSRGRKRWEIWLGSESMNATRGMEIRDRTECGMFKFKTVEGRRGSFEQIGRRKTGREIAAEGWGGRGSHPK